MMVENDVRVGKKYVITAREHLTYKHYFPVGTIIKVVRVVKGFNTLFVGRADINGEPLEQILVPEVFEAVKD